MKVIVSGRWNRHSSERPAAENLWRTREQHDTGKATPGDLCRAQDEVIKLLLRELEETGISMTSDGGIRHDSVYDISRRIMGCGGFLGLTRIPNTNHFHRQPEIKGLMVWRPILSEDLMFTKENTKLPVVVCLPGPHSLAKQTRYSGGTGYFEALASAYAKILNQELKSLLSNGADLVRIEEPQILSRPKDWNLFKSLMAALTADTDISRVALATWYGGINHLPGYFSLPFGTFFIDFVEGNESIDALKNFPKDKRLVAGIFDGRHTHEEQEGKLLNLLAFVARDVPPENILISSNTDFHFLPWDEALKKVRQMVAFAKKADFPSSLNLRCRGVEKSRVPPPLPAVLEPGKEARESLLAKLEEKTFITSAVGSYPQTPQIRGARKDLRLGKLDQASYKRLVQERTREWMTIQEAIDLSVPVDGEFLRPDMAEHFSLNFGGERIGPVPSYENRRYWPVEIYREIFSKRDLTPEEFKFAASLTRHPVKTTITGPATLADWAILKNSKYYHDRVFLRRHLTEVLRKEIEALISAGAACIQVDEPALTTKMKSFTDDIQAIYNTVRGFENKVYLVLHICYSDMEALDIAFPYILRLPFHQIHMEMAQRNYAMLDFIKKYGFAGKDIGLGVIDVHTDRIESPEEIVKGISRVLELKDVYQTPYFTPENIWIMPDCGQKALNDAVAKEKLTAMVEAAKLCREKFINK